MATTIHTLSSMYAHVMICFYLKAEETRPENKDMFLCISMT